MAAAALPAPAMILISSSQLGRICPPLAHFHPMSAKSEPGMTFFRDWHSPWILSTRRREASGA